MDSRDGEYSLTSKHTGPDVLHQSFGFHHGSCNVVSGECFRRAGLLTLFRLFGEGEHQRLQLSFVNTGGLVENVDEGLPVTVLPDRLSAGGQQQSTHVVERAYMYVMISPCSSGPASMSAPAQWKSWSTVSIAPIAQVAICPAVLRRISVTARGEGIRTYYTGFSSISGAGVASRSWMRCSFASQAFSTYGACSSGVISFHLAEANWRAEATS